MLSRNSSSPLGIDAFKVTENQNQSVGSIKFILRASGPTADDVSESRGRASTCPHWHCGSLKVLELHAQMCQKSAPGPDMLCPTVGLIIAGREAHQDPAARSAPRSPWFVTQCGELYSLSVVPEQLRGQRRKVVSCSQEGGC